MPNNYDLEKEAHQLRSEKGNLEHRRGEIQRRINQIESRLMAIKWASHPIGSTMIDSKGDTYQVGGYANYWMLGYKIKKDGTPGSRLVPIVTKKEKI